MWNRHVTRTALTGAIAISAALAAVRVDAQDSTAAIKYKSLTITPVGFVAAEGLWRQKNITADVLSSFNAIPFSGTTAAQMTEMRLSGRQSRLGLAVAGSMGAYKVAGYWDSDFLGSGTTSNSNQSNAYMPRLRQFWGAVAAGSWTFSGGQMFTLVTPSKTGLLNRGEHLPTTIDGQFLPGFTWARQGSFRAVRRVSDVTSFAVALEGAQTTFSGRNLPTNFIIGQAGGSVLNSTANYSTDVAPDVAAKWAFDPKGKGHWELKAVMRQMRDRIVDPSNTSGGSRNLSTTALGYGFGVNLPVMRAGRSVVDFSASGLWGAGVGRYGSAQLPDATIGPDGSIQPIRGGQAIVMIETHPTKSLDVYLYGGAEYADRTAYTNAAGMGVGYGSPQNVNSGCTTEAAPTNQATPNSGTCQADTRAVWQRSAGFWYRYYKGAGGTLQWGVQYSYTSKNSWSGVSGIQPEAVNHMLFASVRYLLP